MVVFPLAATGLFHPFSPHEGSWWSLEPAITIGLLGLALLYLLAVGPYRRRLGGPAQLERGPTVCFLSAIMLIFVSLQGPLHELSDYYSFGAHMLQHLLVTLIMPPLLLKGLPAWLLDPLLRMRYVFPVARFITSPFIAFAIFNVVFALWHVPGFYQRALGQPGVHSLEHSLFMGTALLTWWPIFSPTALLPRLNDPLQMLYLFAQSIIPTVLGAMITFADIVLYPYYEAAPRVVGLSVLDDQQAAGLLMWLGGATIVLLVLTHRFFRWMELDADDRIEPTRAA